MWQITNRSMTVLDCQARYHFEMLSPLLAGAPNDSHLHWSCHSFDHLLSRVSPIYRMRGQKSMGSYLTEHPLICKFLLAPAILF